jgi:hypothetical protein
MCRKGGQKHQLLIKYLEGHRAEIAYLRVLSMAQAVDEGAG